VVDFYRKMRRDRVYPLRLAWRNTPPPGASWPQVVARPIVPGALVTPAQQPVAATDAETVFYVTPLGRGRAPGARIELTPPQGPAQQILLPLKVVTQRLTKFLLLLTLVVPPLLYYVTRDGRLEGDVFKQVPGPAGADKQKTHLVRIKAEPGELLAMWFKDARNFPQVPNVTEEMADGLGQAYTFLCTVAGADPLAVYVAGFLLFLTIASWLTHLGARDRRVKAIPLGQAAPA
jgi:hypothetical protein